jgi:hypothetical protein
LFDLQTDPGEKMNIRDQFPQVVREMHEYVEAQLARMQATMPAEKNSAPDLDEEIIARLRGLGYVE